MKSIFKKVIMIAIIGLCLLAVACEAVQIETQDPTATPPSQTQENLERLASFSAEMLDGTSTYSSSEFAEHKITMINIWATWCGPCVGELGDLGKIAREYESSGLDLVGILVDIEDPTSIDTAKGLLESNDATYKNIKLSQTLNELIISKYNISAIPTTLFVNGDGVVVKVVQGARDYAKWSAIIDQLLEAE